MGGGVHRLGDQRTMYVEYNIKYTADGVSVSVNGGQLHTGRIEASIDQLINSDVPMTQILSANVGPRNVIHSVTPIHLILITSLNDTHSAIVRALIGKVCMLQQFTVSQ